MTPTVCNYCEKDDELALFHLKNNHRMIIAMCPDHRHAFVEHNGRLWEAA